MRDVDPWGTVVEIRVHENGSGTDGPLVAMLFREQQDLRADRPWLVVAPNRVQPNGEGTGWAADVDVADWTVVR